MTTGDIALSILGIIALIVFLLIVTRNSEGGWG